MLKKMRYASLAIILSSCIHLPEKPSVFLCTPIFKEDSISKSTAFCRNIKTGEEIELPLRHIEIGMGGADWELTDKYIKELKRAAQEHCSKDLK